MTLLRELAMGAAFLGVLALGHCSRQPPRAAAELQQARQAAASAKSQGEIDRSAARAGDQAARAALQTLAVSQEAQHAVQTSPGADAPLDPDLLARFDAGVQRVWASGAPAAGGPVGADPGQPAGAVPPAGQDGRAHGG